MTINKRIWSEIKKKQLFFEPFKTPSVIYIESNNCFFGSIKHKRRGTVKKSKYACKMPWIMKQKRGNNKKHTRLLYS